MFGRQVERPHFLAWAHQLETRLSRGQHDDGIQVRLLGPLANVVQEGVQLGRHLPRPGLALHHVIESELWGLARVAATVVRARNLHHGFQVALGKTEKSRGGVAVYGPARGHHQRLHGDGAAVRPIGLNGIAVPGGQTFLAVGHQGVGRARQLTVVERARLAPDSSRGVDNGGPP